MTVQQTILELNKVSVDVKTFFGNLSKEQLNWKPAENKWSIAQCLHHLIVANKSYYPQFDAIISETRKNSFYQNMKFIARLFGKQMIHDLGPKKPRTFKNPKILTPSHSGIPLSIITDFLLHNEELKIYFGKLEGKDLENTIIYSPVSKIVIYNLKDVIEMLAGHEQRHLIQAQNVLNHPKFPK